MGIFDAPPDVDNKNTGFLRTLKYPHPVAPPDMFAAFRRLLLLAICVIAVPGVWAQTSASHTVTIGVQPISVMAVSGNPLPLSLSSEFSAGPDQSVDASTHYNLTTNVDGVQIEAALDFPMPPGLQLRLRAETSLGQSLGTVVLSTSTRAGRLINGIGRGLENGRILEYELLQIGEAGLIPLQERRVTLAIVNPETGYRQEVSQIVSFTVGDSFFEDPVIESN